MPSTKATGQSSLVEGSWTDVTLGHEGLGLLSTVLAVDAAHGDAYAVVTPAQQASILYAGAPFWGKKLAEPQLESLSFFQDELEDLSAVQTGADTLAAMAAPANPPVLIVEKQAVALAETLGLDVSKIRKLPRVVGGKLDLGTFARLKAVAKVPIEVVWLRSLAAKYKVDCPADDDAVGWLYSMERLRVLLPHQASAVLAASVGTVAEWDAAVGAIGADGRVSDAFASTRLQAAAEKAASAVPAGDEFVEAHTALMFAEEFVARMAVFPVLGAAAAAGAIAGGHAPVPDPVATLKEKKAFWHAAAKMLGAQGWHEYSVSASDPDTAVKIVVGSALRAVGKAKGLSPKALQRPASAGMDAKPEELYQLIMSFTGPGRQAGASAAGGGAVQAAVLQVDATALAAAFAPIAAASSRASAKAGGKEPPAPDDTLRVGNNDAAVGKKQYVQSEDTAIYLEVYDEIWAALQEVRKPGYDRAAVHKSLSSKAQWMLGREVHTNDKTKEPRLGPLTELQAALTKGAVKACKSWVEEHRDTIFSCGEAEDSRETKHKKAVAAMRRADVEHGGPHTMDPWGSTKDLWAFIKSRVSEDGSKAAVRMRDNWNAILREWATEFEMNAGPETGWVAGAELIIDTLKYDAKSEAEVKWTEQQETYYVGVLLWTWFNHDQKWYDSPLTEERKTVKQIAGMKYCKAFRKDLHNFTPQRASDETPFNQLKLGGGTSFAALPPRAGSPSSKKTSRRSGGGGSDTDGEGMDSSGGYYSDRSSSSHSSPPSTKKPKAAKPTASECSLSQLTQSLQKQVQALSGVSNTLKHRTGDGGAQTKNQFNAGATDGGGSKQRGVTAIFSYKEPWYEIGVSAIQCMKAQEKVNKPSYTGCLKNTCIYVLRCADGCSCGGDLGEMGLCGNAHFLAESHKEEAPTELKKLLELDSFPQIQHSFFVKSALGGQGGRGAGGGRGGGKGKGAGRGGGKGRGKGGGKG